MSAPVRSLPTSPDDAPAPRALDWIGVDAAGLDASGLVLDPLRIAHARLRHCRLDGAAVRATLQACVLRGCTFDGATWLAPELAADVRFEGTALRGSRWRGGHVAARFEACDLSRVDARDVEFAVAGLFAGCRIGGRFERCTFRARLVDCDLRDAEFLDCRFEGARFEACRFASAVRVVVDWTALAERARENFAAAPLEPAARAAALRWLEARLARAHLATDDVIDARDLVARFGPATGNALFALLAG